MEITYFFILVIILFMLFYITNNKKIKETFDGIIYQKTKQCSKDEINKAYKEYIFSTPKFIR